jgi:hypothetical protein
MNAARSVEPVEPNHEALDRQPLPGEWTQTIAPKPLPKTIRQRTSLPVQAFRFAMVSLRMLKIIGRSHAR